MLMQNDDQTMSEETLVTVKRFNDAFNGQDLDSLMGLLTADCVFENTSPSPAGTRYQGREAVMQAFEGFFRASPRAVFTVEEQFACGNRAVVRWLYRWGDDADQPGYVRGVDVFRIDEGKIAEKLSYVKG